MVELWLIPFACIAIYSAMGGLTWLMFDMSFEEKWFNDNPIPIFGSMAWPVGLPALFGWIIAREVVKSCGWWRKRTLLQRELDEARRKKDEQDAADALKEEYR